MAANANGASATSRRSHRGVREEDSASSSDPYVLYDGDLKDDIARRCFCGVYAIMYMSRTSRNPKRVFMGCPFYKGNQPHCKFFLWVDEHLARIGSSGCVLDKTPLVEKKAEKEAKVVEECEGFQHRIAILEEKVTVLEKKRNPLACCVVIVVCAVMAAFYVCSD
ncbi:uncharacterized protein DS421_6g173020 [Arachis hypogaea]|uniref:GRF-type domain-containing protein n=1 Tax=Arachis hypogaea TaxID=3818 RepID=A0A445CLB6_ARAHY|nr:uncharacterized protein DS421_6g173020 [Arachis hypogaea]RYR51714.1 hypothetical protein Ahy_A06g026696 [Arachis hypogaea]